SAGSGSMGRGQTPPLSCLMQLPREESSLGQPGRPRLSAVCGPHLIGGHYTVVIGVDLVELGELGRKELLGTDLAVMVRIEPLEQLVGRFGRVDRGGRAEKLR